MNITTAVPLALIMSASALLAQSEPAFEVASLRPSQGIVNGENMRTTPGTLTVEGSSMNHLLEWAYGIQESQIQGSPDWFRDTRFTISAKAGDTADDDRLRLMLRTLLAQRFGLKVHHELKDLPTFELTLAKGGPRFHESGPKDASKFLESTTTGDPQFSKDKGGLTAQRVTMAQIADALSEPLQRQVLDKTGLKGRYDFRIDITAYMSPGGDGSQPQLDPIALIFNALQGQLGLKVEAGKDKVDVLVIDAVNRTPTEN
jgi:uncharacterized protein (TIGR03435 family)